jgi:hypothetical protein
MEVPEMVLVRVQLTKKQFERIKQIAGERNTSVSEVVRQGMDYFLRNSVTVSQEERVRRALEIVGRFRSGGRDGSARHDEHLAEAYGQ